MIKTFPNYAEAFGIEQRVGYSCSLGIDEGPGPNRLQPE